MDGISAWIVKKEGYSVRDHGSSKVTIIGKCMTRVPGFHFGEKLVRMASQVMDRD